MGGSPLLGQVAPGDHVCWTVDDDATRIEAIAGFVRAGLSARHRVVYCGDDPEALLDGLERHGVDGRAAVEEHLLQAIPAEAVYLPGGVFDPEATLELWRGEIARIRAAGYPGIRMVADMTWASRRVPGAERLPWYEAQVNAFFLDEYVAAVCAYDRRRFDPLALRRLGWAHPGAVAARVPFEPRSSLRARRTHDPYGLRLAGEVDRSNREALRTMIEHLFDDGPAATVDVSGLAFADTAGSRILIEAAARGPLRLVGVSPPLRRLLDFHGAGGVAGLTVAPPD
ncbi:MEDS domain-containing protein [Actinoplanes sp. KI2]|uniref:MEDS domain-containing protein n=1 Tax=Actinoplanes sp. KI2 TaxID=2983315 RepID=UPI0021D58D9F|nr:MEDS domain-containing protein [Actinoplanes sp. KI2]MCU7727670.1 MEDS domain-containing protein [Actinoplanes sp. KI2]